MIGIEEMTKLAMMRERVYRCVEEELSRGDGHKSYEGSWDVSLSFPSIFDRGEAPTWCISLHAYVLDLSGRHETWTGKTLAEALAKAEQDIDRLCRPYEFERFARQMDACCDEPEEADGSATIYADPRPRGQDKGG